MKIRLAIIFLVTFVFYLAFNAYLPITDPVESNYALTAKEMLLSHDWVSPRIYGHFWFDKPIMIYWLIALSFKIFGITEFAARLPAAIFSALSVSFTYWFTQRLFYNYKISGLSALVLATSLEYWILSRMVITDSVLFFYTSVSLATLYLGIKEQNYRYVILAYAAAGLAVLTKGPVGLVLPGLIILIFIVGTRQWRYLAKVFYIPGIMGFLLVTVPWYLIMYQLHGSNFINVFFGLNNYLRATVSEHPKDNVFYYYLVLFPVSVLPWAGVLCKGLFTTLRRKMKDLDMAFLVIWMLTIIIFYSLMATKYPTYAFPGMFPAAIIMGVTLYTMSTRREWLWVTVPTILLLLIVGAGAKHLSPNSNWILLYVLVALSVITLLWLQVKGNLRRIPYVCGLMVGVMSLILIHSGLIALADSRSAKIVSLQLPQTGAVVASYGEYATSAVYYSGYLIPRLVHEQEVVDSGVWSGKYTMPQERISAFTAVNANTYVLVSRKYQEKFIKEPMAAKFTPVYQSRDIILYQGKK